MSVASGVPLFQISLKNSELKTTHNTFQDCRVHFFQQTFLKIAVERSFKMYMGHFGVA